jgi:hypothetical protein
MTVAVPHYPRPAIFSEDSRCIPSGVRSPACLASCQPFLRPTGPSSPRRYASARRRGSARANRPAMRACRASSPAAHARTSSMSAAPRWPPARSLPPGSAGLPAHPSWRAGTLPDPKCGWSIKRGGCRIKNSYLVTASGHEPDLQSNCCSRALVVQEGLRTDRLLLSLSTARRSRRPTAICVRRVGFLNVPSYGAALGDAWRAGPLLAARPARPRVTPDRLLASLPTPACRKAGWVCAFGWVVTDAVARVRAQGLSRCPRRGAAWCG